MTNIHSQNDLKLAAEDLVSERIYQEKLLDERIHQEQLNIIAGAIGSTGGAVVYYLVANNYLDTIRNPSYLIYWLAAQIFLTVTWTLFIRLYKNKAGYRRAWRITSISTSSVYGLFWSTCWFLFIDIETSELFMVWLYISAGVISGGVYATAFHWPSTVSFLCCLTLPVIADLFINVDAHYNWVAYLLAGGFIFGVAFSYLLNRFMIGAIEQREKNYLLAKQLEKEKQQVEKASQEKTRFLAAASHDLRQPIQAIRLFEHILGARLSDPEDKALLKKLQNSTSSLSSLLDSLLDISQLDAGIINIKKQTFCIDDVLSVVHQQHRPIAAKKNIELRYVESQAYVESDPQQLERIIRNLVVNAIKHMGDGRIILGVRRASSQILVIDNGIGIALTEQQKIFHEFYQLNNTERNRDKGLGLGLAIVQRTASLLGHTVELDPNFKNGCKFAIQLPIIPISKHPIDLCVDSSADTLMFQTQNPKNILIVEDDKEVLSALGSLLKSWGHNTFLAENKTDALRIGQENQIQVILCDYQLQNNDNGIDIILSLRNHYQHKLPAILLTGNTNPTTLKNISNYDIPVLNKPCKAERLAAELNSINNGRDTIIQ